LGDILSKEEIDTLLEEEPAQANPEGEEAQQPDDESAEDQPATSRRSPAREVGRRAVTYEVYDFRRPDKLNKDQLRTLQMVHETFGRLVSSSLSAFLRTPVTVELIALEQVPYEEYLRSINQSVFTILSIQPLTGQAVLELEFGVAFTMIDRMLGGPGRSITRTVLTDIERPLVRQLVERMFASLKSSWEGIAVIGPAIESMETSSQFVQVSPPTDIVVTMLFEVKLGQQVGAMSLCIPYLVLKPIAPKLTAQKWFVTGTRRSNAEAREMLTGQINEAQVECSVRLGVGKIRVQELLSLKVGDIVRLDQRTDSKLLFLVGNVPKLLGTPAREANKLVFSVTGPAI